MLFFLIFPQTPPRLFPVSITPDSKDVDLLISCFQKADVNDIKELTDKINGGSQVVSQRTL